VVLKVTKEYKATKGQRENKGYKAIQVPRETPDLVVNKVLKAIKAHVDLREMKAHRANLESVLILQAVRIRMRICPRT
jgi:predicted hydrolase (HD superfamily)